jgi:hypothetical protein
LIRAVDRAEAAGSFAENGAVVVKPEHWEVEPIAPPSSSGQHVRQ